MLDLIEAVEGRNAARVRALLHTVSPQAMEIVVGHLTSAMSGESDRDWRPTIQAVLGSGKVSPEVREGIFAQACRIGCTSGVRACVEAGCPINLSEDEQYHACWASRLPLTLAAEHDHAEVVRYLLTQGAEVDRYDNQGQTALHAAVAAEACDSFQVLREAGADVQLRYRGEIDAFHHLVNRVQYNCSTVDGLEMAKLLIEAGLPTTLPAQKSGATVRERMLSNRTMEQWVPTLDACEQAQALERTIDTPAHAGRSSPRL